jgi:phosphoribosylformylglycinamidine cyclo-ligase
MSDAYAAAGVDTSQADRGVDALVRVLRTIELDRPSASVLASGHYASVLRITPQLGIALSTDGVGSKIVVAEQAGRLETVGIDCIAMNVNDIVCVGAEPIAMLDYLAVEQVDPEALARIAAGLKIGAQSANIEIPGGELAVLPELIRGRPTASTCAARRSAPSRWTRS